MVLYPFSAIMDISENVLLICPSNGSTGPDDDDSISLLVNICLICTLANIVLPTDLELKEREMHRLT